MRLLADEDLPKVIVDELRSEGHEVLWVATNFAQWDDPAILERAELEACFVLTLDEDFAQIARQRRILLKRSDVALFRVHPATIERIRQFVKYFLASPGRWAGNVIVVTPDSLTLAPLARGK